MGEAHFCGWPEGSEQCRMWHHRAAPIMRPGDRERMAAFASAPAFYVASRASNPARPAMWRALRDCGVRITSTWVDEAGEGETEDLSELWSRICSEVSACDALILYAEPNDFPLKGALIEVGMALAMNKPIYAVLPSVVLEPRSMRPVGSWLHHRNVQIVETISMAIQLARTP